MISKNKTIPMFIVAAFAVFLATFNETFLNVALDAMGNDMQVGFSTVQWLVTAYMLGAAIMVPISAFMFRKVPTKILFLTTVGCFIVGSLLGALAGNNFILVLIARVIQAIGSGMLIPVAMNIVLCIAPREKLGTYMGIMGAMTTLGPSISIIVAGLLMTTGNFHLLFWVFGGLSLICFVMSAFFVGNVAKLSKPKLDVLSVILISIALVGILFAISFVFTIWYIALIVLAVGILALVWFVVRQNKLDDPLINLRPLKVKAFSISVLLNMFGLIMIFAFNVLLPKYLIKVVGADALTASLTLFPAIFLSCIFSPLAGKIYDKHGAKWLLVIGFVLMTIFSVALALFIADASLIWIGAMYVPVIIGSALIIGPVQSYGLSSLKPQDNPHGVTIFSTGFQIAGCIGASLFASIYASINVANTAILLVSLLIAGVGLLGLIFSIMLNIIKKREKEKVVPVEENTQIKTIKDIMKTDVYTIHKDDTILDAMKLFISKNISGCPIVDSENNFVGFISDGDIVRFLAKNQTSFKLVYSYEAIDGEQSQFDSKLAELVNLSVSDVASKNIFYVDINQDLGEVCRTLGETHKKKVPVMENGKMVGIVTRSDITKYALNFNIKQLAKGKALKGETNLATSAEEKVTSD